ncbi:TolC family protein [Clostridium peptidivorans]|uniref:TolC family protein n=1 Tax=Clostridium peptidivorans TaxID=100174 RepID=UPI000BE48955|nr:TolC family protein [Clostridium peptidivorans]
MQKHYIKKHKIISLIGITVLIAAVFYGGKINVTASNNNVSRTDAIKLALDNNRDLGQLLEKNKTAKLDYEEAVDVKYKEGDSELETAKRQDLYPMKTEKAVKDSENEISEKKKSLEVDVEEKYFSILIQDELINLQNYKVETLYKQLENKNKQVEQGTMEKTSTMVEELNLEVGKSELLKLQREKQNLLMNLKNIMGKNFNDNIVLSSGEIPVAELKLKNLDDTIKQKVQDSYEVVSLEKNKELLEKEKEVTNDNNAEELYDDQIKILGNNIIQANYDIKDKQISIEYKLRSDYNSLLNLKDDIEIKKLDYEKNKKLWESAVKRQEVGMSTEIETRQAKKVMDNSGILLKQAQLKYYVAVRNFNNLIN